MRRQNGHIVRALTIAGSDSGGGAGIQADLKTFSAFSVYGTSAITALTAQNTMGVQGIQYVPPGFVAKQLASVFADIGADAVKTGMLGSADIIRVVADELRNHGVHGLVVDPVMVAKGGARLIDEDAVGALKTTLFPLAQVITPNIPEAEVLCGYPIQSWADCRRAAQDLARLGAETVVVKGGHAQAAWRDEVPWSGQTKAGVAADVVFAQGTYTYFVTPRVDSHKTHGTGCTFSSALAAGIAIGLPVLEAIATAKVFIYRAIAAATTWDVGGGHGPTDHSVTPDLCRGVDAGSAWWWADPDWIRIEGVR